MKWRLPACSAAAGHRIDIASSILDMSGMSMATLTRSALGLIQYGSKTANDYYPETLHRAYLVNCPFMFPAIWALIKPFVDEKTVRKVIIMGSDFKSVLLENVDAEILPDFLGGTCTCKEFGTNCMLSNIGPWLDYTLVNEPLGIKSKKSD